MLLYLLSDGKNDFIYVIFLLCKDHWISVSSASLIRFLFILGFTGFLFLFLKFELPE